jgi:hypothetical protein
MQCFLSLLKEFKIFCVGKGQLVSHFEDASWMYDLAFLTGIFGHLNDLYRKLQEKCQFVSELYNNIAAIQNEIIIISLI